MPIEWNGWRIEPIFWWYCARKGGKVKWLFWEEIPLLTGRGSDERHKIAWLNREFPA